MLTKIKVDSKPDRRHHRDMDKMIVAKFRSKCPSHIDTFSRHEVKVVNVNKHGHISVELLGGPAKGSIRGIKPNQINCLQKVS